MKEQQNLESVSALGGEYLLRGLLESAEKRAQVLVEKRRARLEKPKEEEIQRLREQCMALAFLEELRPYANTLLGERIMSRHFWTKAAIQASLNVAVAGAAIAVIGAATRTRAETTATAKETESPFVEPAFKASERPRKAI